MKGEFYFQGMLDRLYGHIPDADTDTVVLREIYRQGRADQNEADVNVVERNSYNLESVNMAKAIRAAGPEEK